ncbi:organic anion transporter 3-like [Mytilus californianus]|uniref:organic anion transporter 3-like n=1 Tax=Mytilus californianus TaxID=6549 RepID=UPI0022482D1C|nr:organic anion transporter 3-like [Mytilus californianus]
MDPGTDVDHVLQSLGNVGRSDIRVRYGKCNIDIYVNDTDAEYHSSQSCSNGYAYEIPKDRSTVTEWDLVCEGSARSEFAQTLIMMGQAVGAAIFSPLSDRFGRKPINIISRILYTIAGVTAMFSPSIEVFSVYRLLIGTFQGINLQQTVQFIDESLRWLLANGKTDKAMKIIKKAASWNNQSYESVMKSVEKKNLLIPKEHIIHPPENQESISKVESCVSNGTTELDHTVHRYSVITVLKHKRILITSLLLWVIWITNTLTYYGLMLTTSRLAGDRYVNNILAALSEIPATFVQQISINRIGRRYVLVMFHSFAGVTLILATVCFTYSGTYYWLKHFSTFFSIFGRFSAAGSFSSIFLYTPELYPTNLRNVGLGMASTVSRIGSMISPFAATLADHVFWGPAIIFALLNIICTIILLTLPETMGRELPTTVEEMKSWVKDKKGIFDIRRPKHYLKENKQHR